MSRFIAAIDHSGGSTGGALERYEQEYTEADKMDKIHAMRVRMVNSPDFNDKNIWGAILYKDTVTRGMVNILDEMGIESFLKIDNGVEANGMLKQFPVKQILEFATSTDTNGASIGPKIYGTKMRSVVLSESMVGAVLRQQFHIAETISQYGLMPIIEPEIPIDHPEKAALEDELYRLLNVYLDTFRKFKVILKLTPPETPNLYHNLTVHPRVDNLVFLSGGYSTNEACNKLGLNDNVTASFSRALTEGLTYNQTDKEFNTKLSHNIKTVAEASN